MAINDFWMSIRTALNLSSPQAVVDSPRLDSAKIESILRSASLWLTPKAVESFDPKDFTFLTVAEQKELDEGVKQFRAASTKVSGDAPATSEQIREAIPPFQKILGVIRPDKYSDPEALALGKQIEREVSGKLPSWVRELIFETGDDVSGEPALWIWVEVDDKALDEKEILRRFDSIREKLRTAAFRICPHRWPFIRLREVSERMTAEGDGTKKKSKRTKSKT